MVMNIVSVAGGGARAETALFAWKNCGGFLTAVYFDPPSRFVIFGLFLHPIVMPHDSSVNDNLL